MSATVTALVAVVIARSIERQVVRGESMVPTLSPRDTVLTVKAHSPLGVLFRPRRQSIAVIALPWEHDLLGVKRLVARPWEAWAEGDQRVAAGPGWVAVGDQRVLSTDSRHHGRVPTESIRGIVVAKVKPAASPTAPVTPLAE